MFQVSYKGAHQISSVELEIRRLSQHWKFLCVVLLHDQVIIHSSVIQRNIFNNVTEFCMFILLHVVYFMPIKNVTPDGLDNN